MSLLFMDSFDHYATADFLEKWTNISTHGSINQIVSPGNGRRGSGSYRGAFIGGSGGSTYGLQKAINTINTTCIVGIAIKMPSAWLTGQQGLISIRDGSSVQISLRVNTDGTFTVTRGPFNTAGVFNVVPLAFDVFTYVELKVLISQSVGTLAVRVNGINAGPPLTGLNTSDTGAARWTSIMIGVPDTSSHQNINKNMDFDDVYVSDAAGIAPWNDFLGDIRVDPRFVTAAGATTGWTPSTGSNFQNVDEAVPNDDTDFNSAPAPGLTDTFIIQDSPFVGATIYGVQHNISAKKVDSGVGTIAPVIRHSGVDNIGADIGLGTSYNYLTQVAQVNPGTGAAWTEAGFNAAEFGYRRTN